MSEFIEINQDRHKIHLSRPEGEISRRDLLKRLSPLGKVELDTLKCTGCGLCVQDCPTGALTASSSEETDTYQLLFKHDDCVACGRCVELCPEKCLRLERVIELDKIGSPAIVLFEDIIVRCSDCGSPIASKAMIDKLRSKVPVTGQLFSSRFELCPICKVKAQFSIDRDTRVKEYRGRLKS